MTFLGWWSFNGQCYQGRSKKNFVALLTCHQFCHHVQTLHFNPLVQAFNQFASLS